MIIMIKFNKEKKVLTINLLDEEKEDEIQRWVFVQIYKPSTTSKIKINLKNKSDNIYKFAFES